MSDIAIKVENLGKKYTLGGQKSGSFRESITRLFSKNVTARAAARGSIPVEKADSEFWALKDVSFEIKQGEAVGIIGRNGAGKSTLLKILSRITEPTKGRFEVFGRVSSLLEVGTGFHPELTGRENVYLNGTILGMKRREVKAKFDEIVAFSGVEKFIDTPVKHYSSGMQVRLAFAVAAHLEPEILIIDEVLAVGDAEFQKKCLGKMEDVTGQGRTVLFVSHNMAAVENLCHKSLCISNGIITLSGKTTDVIDEYLRKSSNGTDHATLDKRKDRKGNLKLMFKSIRFLDKHKKEVESLKSGEDYLLQIRLKVNVAIDVNKLIIAVGISNSKGVRIGLFSNELTNQFDVFIYEGNEIVVNIFIRKIPFKEGEYFFTLFAKDNYSVIDWLQDAGSIEVVGGDFYQTGKSLPNGQGDLFLEHSFIWND